ncbi:hypothetical protein F0562_006127 [Nyssa sinensis]|uniref:Uncharacterized protein n=1 Tax=Nyssa sinensis TaxID=561372 RepID=A0A5J5ALC0_9ASTE|nr:hypothetical protein F0562_006127 [Nyssa sinensis]
MVRTMVSNAKFEVEKFDGTNNLGVWQCEVLDVLVQQELDITLEDKLDNMEDKDWVHRDSTSKTLIVRGRTEDRNYGGRGKSRRVSSDRRIPEKDECAFYHEKLRTLEKRLSELKNKIYKGPNVNIKQKNAQEESISQQVELEAPVVAVKTVQIVDSSVVNIDDEGSSSDVEEAQEIPQQPKSITASR